MNVEELWEKINNQQKSFFFIGGPCVIESEEITKNICKRLKEITSKLNILFIFKASFDKANRTSINSFRGLGLKKGIEILSSIKKEFAVNILTDVHETYQCEEVATIADIIQIPALLSRQTDLILAAAKTNRIINIKKGQFMAPWDIKYVIEKVLKAGNEKIILTERGTSFGYNNLILDFRSFGIMKKFGKPVVADVSHSIQLPSAAGAYSDGNNEFIAPLARAAIAFGVDGIFMEVHEEPKQALSDAANSFKLDNIESLLKMLLRISSAINFQ